MEVLKILKGLEPKFKLSIKENKKKKPKPDPHKNREKNVPDLSKDNTVDMIQGIEIKTVKAIT